MINQKKSAEVENPEQTRLEQSRRKEKHWKQWGPYLSERAWGTVREDYSANGTAWDSFPHDHARSRAYRWNEDGLGGICDNHQNLCFALALWNGHDPIVKERLFGLTGSEGNHGEDVKEYYFYVDSTPTHSYMKFLYKYPQAAFPYNELVSENARRGKHETEFELLDTGIFDEDRYFDVQVEYAKADVDDIAIRITITNRGTDAASLDVLPTLWFRNTWSWTGDEKVPEITVVKNRSGQSRFLAKKVEFDSYGLCFEGSPDLLFTENETNYERLYGSSNRSFTKDGINDVVVSGRMQAVNPENRGSKAAARYKVDLQGGQSAVLRLRLTKGDGLTDAFKGFDAIFQARVAEADDYYAAIIPAELNDDERNVMRQSLAGLLWSKQFYHYVVKEWLDGDPKQPPPPSERNTGRNSKWGHLYNADVLSMPDKWEYPWFAAWDLAFHCIALSIVDADFAKSQLSLMLREWYMHPNGQLPAYEWAFGDVNPPVHAWAVWRVYRIEERRRGSGDLKFLESAFHKLLLNFTWWVNQKDADGLNVFEGGFLGLDNIGVFDRSSPLPVAGLIEQSDGTSWMAMYTLNMLTIASELARYNPAYEDVASKFWEHFLYIAHAMTHICVDGKGLWDSEDGFFYDVLYSKSGDWERMKVRSLVGLTPLFAVETLESADLDRMPDFTRRLNWFVKNRPDLTSNVARMHGGQNDRLLLSIIDEERLRAILRLMLDEKEFLSPYGVRALSRSHLESPYIKHVGGTEYRVDYEPAESTSGLFGGNSNWRGPIWFPMNYLIIESLQKYHFFYGDSFKVECPTGSGTLMTLAQVSAELSNRLSAIFLKNEAGQRPVYGSIEKFQCDPHWKDLLLFFEYFHGDHGSGVGASHQTGWTGLVAKLLQQSGGQNPVSSTHK
jgi:mannosylglycerate hydrolase MGH1-like protein/glycosyl hydrolase family 63